MQCGWATSKHTWRPTFYIQCQAFKIDCQTCPFWLEICVKIWHLSSHLSDPHANWDQKNTPPVSRVTQSKLVGSWIRRNDTSADGASVGIVTALLLWLPWGGVLCKNKSYDFSLFPYICAFITPRLAHSGEGQTNLNWFSRKLPYYWGAKFKQFCQIHKHTSSKPGRCPGFLLKNHPHE